MCTAPCRAMVCTFHPELACRHTQVGLVAAEGATASVMECDEAHICCKSCAMACLLMSGNNLGVHNPK